MIMRLLRVLIITTLILAGLPAKAVAAYVLPYPSAMPGNKLYRISRIIDRLKEYWSVGGISATKYHMALSDKYLVEAKTLMEYEQYLLATEALIRSDHEFLMIPAALSAAVRNHIDISTLKNTVTDESEKHISVLMQIKNTVPPHITWTPEKTKPTELPLLVAIEHAISVRQQASQEMGTL